MVGTDQGNKTEGIDMEGGPFPDIVQRHAASKHEIFRTVGHGCKCGEKIGATDIKERSRTRLRKGIRIWQSNETESEPRRAAFSLVGEQRLVRVCLSRARRGLLAEAEASLGVAQHLKMVRGGIFGCKNCRHGMHKPSTGG